MSDNFSGCDKSLIVAMKDLQKSKEKLLHLQKLAGIGGFEYLPEEKTIILSQEACVVLGIDASKLVYSIDEFCKLTRMGQYDKFYQKLLNINDFSDDTVEMLIKDDSRTIRYVEAIFESPSGVLADSITGVFHDITKKRRAEIFTKDRAEAFETVFENAKIAILVLNLKGEIIRNNKGAETLLGYSSGEMVNMHSVKLLQQEDIISAAKIFARFIHSAGRQNIVEYKVVKKDGEVIDVLANFEMIIGSEGERIYLFLTDISEIKRMEKKHIDQERMLIQQSKMATLGEMIALISHQWQQPLNSIAMIVQMLEELVEVDDANMKLLNKSVDSVMAQVSFMSSTMEDFRNFLKPANIKCDFEVYRVVNEVVELYRPQLKYYDIKCDIFVECDSLKKTKVNGYENELKNVFLNFLTNSRDAIEANNPSDGSIQIGIRDAGEDVTVCITDNGGGLKPEIASKIFDPYVTSKGDKGTGLGLYMAKLIVKDRMGGDIRITNLKDGLQICVVLKKLAGR
jgi:PAS domain S-box-containing protein